MLSSTFSTTPSLIARPPTPPQDTDEEIENAINFLNSDIDLEKPLHVPQQASSSTPPNSSPLRPATLASNVSIVKRVEFLSTPTFHPPANSIQEASSPKSSPARSKLLRPSKSILKLGNISPLPTPDDGDQQSGYFSVDLPESFAKMLESTMKQLESTSKYARLDAYLAINGALSTYEDVPNHQEMSRHMSAFQRFILRDTTIRKLEETTDIQITAQAYKLAARILAYDTFLRCTDSNFQTSMLDRSIAVVEHASLPKPIVKPVIGLLAQQDLPTSLWTSAKVDRLLTALQTIDERCQGTSITATRMLIYRRLMRQARNSMLSRMREWLMHLLNGMLSDIAEIRNRATEVFTAAALEFGNKPPATKILHELMEVQVEGEQSSSYFEHFALRLASFTKNANARLSVPQIWSGVVLFHKSSGRALHKWARFGVWLKLMEPCLFSSDIELMLQAHSAWRKLIFVVQPDSTLPGAVVRTLMTPVRVGLGKSGPDMRSRELRKLALDGYYNVLHYALRPGLDYKALDFAWTSFVTETLNTMARASSKGRLFASRILRGLFTPNPGAWNPNAALESSAILADELPRLDVRWVRDRLSHIIPLIETMLCPMLSAPQVEYQTLAKDVWRCLIQTVVQAGAQEIRFLDEPKTAIIDICNMFSRLMSQVSSNVSDPESKALQESLHHLQMETFQQLGISNLLHEFITLDTTDMSARLAQTSGARQGQCISPLAFVLTYSASASASTVQSILEPFCSSKVTVVAKVQLVSRVWQMISSNVNATYSSGTIWTASAMVLADLISAQNGAVSSDSDALQTLGMGKALLLDGLKISDTHTGTVTAVEKLTLALFRLATHIANEAGPAITIIEPLSRALMEDETFSGSQVVLSFVCTTMHTAFWPSSSQAEEEAVKALIGISGVQKSRSLIYEHFVALADRAVKSWYGQRPKTDGGIGVEDLLNHVCSFTKRCPDSMFERVVARLQTSLSILVEDPDKQLDSSSEYSENAMNQCWTTMLSRLSHCNISLLDPLLLAGFRSTSVQLVNTTIEFWNANFEALEPAQRSDDFQHVLRAIESVAIIKMPDLTVSSQEPPILRLPAFELAQAAAAAGITPSRIRTPQRSRATQHSADVTPSRKPKAKKLFKSPRIRHDDSQVEFVPVEEMPTLRAQDSQLFTDNQREVRDRQLANVGVFPDLSSSPKQAVQEQEPEPRRVILNKLLESSDAAEPAELRDVNVPSSPIPQINDISPDLIPTHDTAVVASSVRAHTAEVIQPNEAEQVENDRSAADDDVTKLNDIIMTDEPQIDMDPDVQRQLEVEMAASLQSSPVKPSTKRRRTPTSLAAPLSARVTRSQDAVSSQETTAPKKRKRGTQESSVEKKKRRTSPVISKSQDDDEIGDCIVVASSQKWVRSQESDPEKPELMVNATPTKPVLHQAAEQSSMTRSGRRHKRGRRSQASQGESPSSNRSAIPATEVENRASPFRTEGEQKAFPSAKATSSTSVVEQTDIEGNEDSSSEPVSPRRAAANGAGIFSLLKEALSQFKTTVLGQKEQREINDLLFELGQANYAAGARGRNTS